MTSVKAAKSELFSVGNNGDRLVIGNVGTGIIRSMPYRIEDVVEVEDKSCNNSHKSHRLVVLKGTMKNE